MRIFVFLSSLIEIKSLFLKNITDFTSFFYFIMFLAKRFCFWYKLAFRIVRMSISMALAKI